MMAKRKVCCWLVWCGFVVCFALTSILSLHLPSLLLTYHTMSDRAAELVKQAEKEKSRWFVSKEQKDSNAADVLEEAANIYKSQNMHKEAADCFSRSAKLKQRIGKAYEAAEMLKMAGIQLKLDGDPTSQSMLNSAVEIFSELGKGQMAAKLSQELGEGSEQAKEYEEALVHFLRAADLYKGEGQDAYARQCMEKVAHFHAAMVPPDYLKAAAIFEELGVDALSSRLGRFNARNFFFRAVLCTMATSDTIGARARHTHCQEVDYQFSASREGRFLNQLLTALEAFDAEQFSKVYCGACLATKCLSTCLRGFDGNRSQRVAYACAIGSRTTYCAFTIKHIAYCIMLMTS